MSQDQFTRFLIEVLGNMADASWDGSIHFVCMDWRHMSELMTAGGRVYDELKNLVVWTKTNGGMGTFYRSRHELIFVFKARRPSMSDDVARKLAALAEMDRPALLQRWRMAFGRDAPPRLSRALMAKAIAYDLQVEAFGGLPSRTTRALRVAAKAGGRSTLTNLPSRGTRLIREWHGTVHDVEVLEDGYLWCGVRYRSLSAIARAITGTRWSGPRFFGLVARP